MAHNHTRAIGMQQQSATYNEEVLSKEVRPGGRHRHLFSKSLRQASQVGDATSKGRQSHRILYFGKAQKVRHWEWAIVI